MQSSENHQVNFGSKPISRKQRMREMEKLRMSHASERPGDGPTADSDTFKSKIEKILENQYRREFKPVELQELIKQPAKNHPTQRMENAISIH